MWYAIFNHIYICHFCSGEFLVFNIIKAVIDKNIIFFNKLSLHDFFLLIKRQANLFSPVNFVTGTLFTFSENLLSIFASCEPLIPSTQES